VTLAGQIDIDNQTEIPIYTTLQTADTEISNMRQFRPSKKGT